MAGRYQQLQIVPEILQGSRLGPKSVLYTLRYPSYPLGDPVRLVVMGGHAGMDHEYCSPAGDLLLESLQGDMEASLAADCSRLRDGELGTL